MGYWDIASMARDADLAARVQACAAQEVDGDPYQWQSANMLDVCASPGWDAAWASAIAAGNENPGRDPAVITDGQILSAVQSLLIPEGDDTEALRLYGSEPGDVGEQ
jgi:hypothetical protein